MQVKQYIYQSPYTSPIQIGRVDPNAPKEDGSATNADATLNKSQLQQEAQTFQEATKQDVEPSVTSNQLLDIYA